MSIVGISSALPTGSTAISVTLSPIPLVTPTTPVTTVGVSSTLPISSSGINTTTSPIYLSTSTPSIPTNTIIGIGCATPLNENVNIVSSPIKAAFNSELKMDIIYTLMFKKAFFTNVEKYNVYAKYKDNENNDEVNLIKVITNDAKTSIVEFEEYTSIEKSILTLPKDIFLDNTHKFKVYKNGVVVEPKCYVFNSYLNTIAFTKDFMYSDKDVIKLKYYKEVIVVEYQTNKVCTFNVKPVFRDRHLLGTHNILV